MMHFRSIKQNRRVTRQPRKNCLAKLLGGVGCLQGQNAFDYDGSRRESMIPPGSILVSTIFSPILVVVLRHALGLACPEYPSTAEPRTPDRLKLPGCR